MKKTLVIISIALLCIAIFPLMSFAEGEVSVDINSESYDITVSGNLGTAEGGSIVSLMILKSGADVSDDDFGDGAFVFSDDIAAFYGTEADINGSYEFDKFKLNGASGEYTLLVSGSNSQRPYSQTVFLVSKSECDALISTVSGKTAEEIFSVLQSSKAALMSMVDASVYYELGDNAKMNVCKALNKDAPYADINGIYEVLNYNSVYEDIISTESAERINDYFFNKDGRLSQAVAETANKILDFESNKNISAVKDFLKFSDSEKSAVFAGIASKKRSSVEALYDALYAAVINHKFESVSAWTQISDILTSYHSDVLTELDLEKYKKADYKTELDKKLVKMNFSTVSELCEYINKYKPSSSGGGGGSSFGSSSSGKRNNVSVISNTPDSSDIRNNTEKFSDLKNYEWAESAILNLYKRNIVTGTSDNEFSPERNVKREEFVKMIVIAANIGGEGAPCSFADVSDGFWAADYISKAVAASVIQGIDDSNFGIGRNISREDMAVIIARILGADDGSIQSESGFSDNDEIAEYAKNAVAKMKELKIMNGFGDNTFAPKALCTRAQAAVVINNLLEYIEAD